MGVFNLMANDRVTLIKKDGRQFENLKAMVQSNTIFSDDSSIPIEDGDEFERRTPSGVVERYEVIDAGFRGAIPGMSAHYQTKVRKSTAPRPVPSSVVYNVTGPNSRVNVHSTDASTNVVSVDSSTLFVNMRQAIKESSLDDSLAQRFNGHIDEMESAPDAKTYAQRYAAFISSAAEHMTLFAPFIPALSQLLK
jgi:hypothetical protein